MSDYQALLLFGVTALLFGGVRYVRAMVDGQTSLSSMILTLFGGAALFAAENASPGGVSAGDIVPALEDLFVSIGRIFL